MRRAAPKAVTPVKDCANANYVDPCERGALAQLRPAAAGPERSAAHPATGFWSLQNVIAQRWPHHHHVDILSVVHFTQCLNTNVQ
jgi:hypothetical protein